MWVTFLVVVLCVALIVAGVSYLSGGEPDAPPVTSSASTPDSTPSNKPQSTGPPGIDLPPDHPTTPLPTTTRAASGRPEEVGTPGKSSKYTWAGTQLNLAANADVTFTAGKKIPTEVYVAGGTTIIDFSQYPMTADISITFYGVTGGTYVLVPPGHAVNVSWTGAAGELSMRDGLGDGFHFTRPSGSHTVPGNRPAFTIAFVSPAGGYYVGTSR
jgi:hypothetical protein